MKTISLSILERLQFPLIYPQSGGLIEMTIVRSLQEKIKFTPKEIREYELKDLSDGKISWNKAKGKDTTFPLEDPEIRVLQKGVDILDKEQRITLDLVDLAKRIQDINKKEE